MLDMTHQTHFRTNGKVAFYVQKHWEVTIIVYFFYFLLIIPLRDSLRLLMGRRIMKGGEEAKECDPNFTSNIIQENQFLLLSPSFKVWSLHEQMHVLRYSLEIVYKQTEWNDCGPKSPTCCTCFVNSLVC